jgi:hypothetical protein
MHRNATVATQGDGHRESDELADFRAKQIRLLASRAEGHISLDRVGAELADFFHGGRQLFAIIVPIEHHVGILHIEQFAKTFDGIETERIVKR